MGPQGREHFAAATRLFGVGTDLAVKSSRSPVILALAAVASVVFTKASLYGCLLRLSVHGVGSIEVAVSPSTLDTPSASAC